MALLLVTWRHRLLWQISRFFVSHTNSRRKQAGSRKLEIFLLHLEISSGDLYAKYNSSRCAQWEIKIVMTRRGIYVTSSPWHHKFSLHYFFRNSLISIFMRIFIKINNLFWLYFLQIFSLEQESWKNYVLLNNFVKWN